jgi:hypothetical protein
MSGKAAVVTLAAEVFDRPHLLAVPSDHLKLIQAGFAVPVDSGFGAVHLGEGFGLLTADAAAGHT